MADSLPSSSFPSSSSIPFEEKDSQERESLENGESREIVPAATGSQWQEGESTLLLRHQLPKRRREVRLEQFEEKLILLTKKGGEGGRCDFGSWQKIYADSLSDQISQQLCYLHNR